MMVTSEASSPESRRTCPPRPVLIVVALMAGQFLIALVRVSLMKDWSRPRGAILGLLLICAICLPWMYGLWRRRNWVRWLTVISGTVGCALTPLNLARLHDPAQVTYYWVQFALTIPVMTILFVPAAGGWYPGSSKSLPAG